MLKSELPPDAKMVFKGEIFEVWQWKQTMFDGSVETFEKIRRVDSADVIATVGDRIILENQEQPHRGAFVCVPGGRCDEGEDALEAARRELREETGYGSDDWSAFRERQPYSALIWTLHTFIARDCRLEGAPHLDAGERIAVRLVSFDEFIEETQRPDFRGSELASYVQRAQYDPAFREELRRRIFGEGAQSAS